MRVKLLKPIINGDMMYGTEAIVDITDEGRARYFVDMGTAEKVAVDTPLTPGQPPPRPLADPKAAQIGDAVADAIAKAFEKLSSRLIPTEKVE
jgi:hypothetical protein